MVEIIISLILAVIIVNAVQKLFMDILTIFTSALLIKACFQYMTYSYPPSSFSDKISPFKYCQ